MFSGLTALFAHVCLRPGWSGRVWTGTVCGWEKTSDHALTWVEDKAASRITLRDTSTLDEGAWPQG